MWNNLVRLWCRNSRFFLSRRIFVKSICTEEWGYTVQCDNLGIFPSLTFYVKSNVISWFHIKSDYSKALNINFSHEKNLQKINHSDFLKSLKLISSISRKIWGIEKLFLFTYYSVIWVIKPNQISEPL